MKTSGSFRIFLLFFAFPFLLPSFAFADIEISESFNEDTTWSPENGVYIINSSFSVPPGITLTILPGTIIKQRVTNDNITPTIFGNLIAEGSSGSPIYFTSFYDDTKGGDTDMTGQTGGDLSHWQGFIFKQGSNIRLNNVEVDFSSYRGGGALRNEGGNLEIYNSRFYDNYVTLFDWVLGYYKLGNAIENISGDITIDNSIVKRSYTAISIESGTASITDNIFEDNFGLALSARGQNSLTLRDNIFRSNKSTAFVDPNKDFTHSGNTSEDLSDRGFNMTGDIKDGTTFHSEDLPIIVKGGLTVREGDTLNIAPGTVIKFGNYPSWGSLNIYGNLVANGTKEENIYFTSILDDSIHGDTNGDGSTTSPTPRSWNAIYLENGSVATLDHSVIRYGGFNYNGEYLPGIAATIYDRGSNFSVNNSLFSDNQDVAIFKDAGNLNILNSEFKENNIGLWSRGGNIKISKSSLSGQGGYAIYNQSGPMIDAQNNWWGDQSGPKDINIQNHPGLGDKIVGDILYDPWLTQDPFLDTEIPDPVIIIPGIMGSELYSDDDLIWPDLLEMFTDINDQFLTDNLLLDSNGKSIKIIKVGSLIEEISLTIPIINIEIKIANYFKALLLNLENNNYKKDQSYFVFEYDWRLDLDYTKELLKQKIDEVKSQTGKEKVNIVAHSMGGLLLKDYIYQYGKNSLNKVIFVGTPHLGAPKAGKILLEGDRLGIPWLEEDRVQEISQNSPALHELLPNQTYFSEFQGYIRKFSLFRDGQLLNYAQTKDYFLNEKNKNPIMFGIAENFYNKNLDNIDFSGVDVYNIAGCKTGTQAVYGLDFTNNKVAQVGYTSGDGTVPLISSDHLNIPSQNKFYVRDAKHSELPSQEGVRDLIISILNDRPNNLEGDISDDSSFCNFRGKKLTWHSPVEIHIYDSLGNHTGPISDNSMEYKVKGVDYDVLGHNKFVFLPTDDGEEYRIEAVGLEEGTFDLNISELENEMYLATEIFNDIPVDTSTKVNFVINDSEDNKIINIDKNGIVSNVNSDATLEGSVALDLVPPQSQIILSGKEYKDGEYKKEVYVEFASTDNNSGILGTWYSLDGGGIFSKYTQKFTLGVEGIYNIRYYSVDKVGNNEDIKQAQVIVGKLSKYLRNLDK